jgi:WD40 repeat protein
MSITPTPLLLLAVLAAGQAPRTDLHDDPLPPGAVSRLGSHRQRHSDVVTALAFSPDGKTLFSGSADKSIRQWNVEGGKELRALPGHGEEVRGLAVTPDGKKLASCGLDQGIRLWDLTDRDKKDNQVLKGVKDGVPNDGVEGLALSPDGALLATACRDGQVALWSVATGALKDTLDGHTGSATCAAFSPDGKTLATGSWDNTVRLWNVKEGKTRMVLKGHTDYVEAVACSPDGKRVASGSKDGTIRLWDTATGKEQTTIDARLRRVWTLAFSRDGKLLLAGGDALDAIRRDSLLAFDVATGKPVWQRPAHSPGSSENSEFRTPIRGTGCLAVSSDGNTLASGGADGRIRYWDITSGRELRPGIGHTDTLSGIACLPADGTVLTASLDGSLRWWQKTGKQMRQVEAHEGGVAAMALSPDAAGIATAGADGNLALWNAARGNRLMSWRGPGRVQCLVFSPDGKSLASAASAKTGTLLVFWDAATGKEVRRLEGLEENVKSITFSPDGKQFAAVSKDELIRRWDTATGKALPELANGVRDVTCLAYAPDGRHLAAGFGGSRSVVLWDAVAGNRLTEFDDEGSPTVAIRFTPDCQTIVTAHEDGKVRLWEVRTGKERRRMEGHLGPLTGLALSRDGRLLASASSDRTVLVWNRLAVSGEGGTQRTRQQLWHDLASEDVHQAYDAVCGLASAPEQALGFLGSRLEPLPRLDARQVARWIRDLDARSFKVREEAMDNLARFGRLVEEPLRKALEGKPSLEAQRRIEDLLKRLKPKDMTSADEESVEEWRRLERAVEVLELIGGEQARALVRKVAEGGDFRPTREARAALRRMQRQR